MWPFRRATTAPTLFGAGPVLPVSDLEKTASYYRDVLGFKLDFLMGDPPTHGSVTRCSVGVQFSCPGRL